MNADMLLFRCALVAQEPGLLRPFADHEPRIGVSNIQAQRRLDRLDAKNFEPKNSTP